MMSTLMKNQNNSEDVGKILKQLEHAKRENERINEYYHQALQSRDREIYRLKRKLNEFIVELDECEKKYKTLRKEYEDYQERVEKLVQEQTDKAYDMYEFEKKQSVMLEEKIKILTAALAQIDEE